jgi:hypothetical protein
MRKIRIFEQISRWMAFVDSTATLTGLLVNTYRHVGTLKK